jgi:hypothetical protein
MDFEEVCLGLFCAVLVPKKLGFHSLKMKVATMAISCQVQVEYGGQANSRARLCNQAVNTLTQGNAFWSMKCYRGIYYYTNYLPDRLIKRVMLTTKIKHITVHTTTLWSLTYKTRHHSCIAFSNNCFICLAKFCLNSERLNIIYFYAFYKRNHFITLSYWN